MAIIKKFRIKSFKNINSIIEFKNVSLSYGRRLILDNLNFKINEGQIFGMLGPNGVGKSTIFNIITGLIKPNAGRIKISNESVNDYPVYLRTRKFKVGLIAITQLPSEIPKNILANMNTKLILGMEMVTERQTVIESSLQDLSRDSRSIASLEKGECIVTSTFTDFAIPIKVPLFQPKPNKKSFMFTGIN